MKGPNYSNKKNPKESRTIPLHGNRVLGNGKDAGVLFKCWYCGFHDRLGRDALGGSASRSGLRHVVPTLPSTPVEGSLIRMRGLSNEFVMTKLRTRLSPVSTTTPTIVLKGSGKTSVGINLLSNGEQEPVHRYYEAVSGIGCPLCGCKNWKGEF